MDDTLKTEVVLFILKRLSDYDFTHYASSVMTKRLQVFLKNSKSGLSSVDQIIASLLDGDEELIEELTQVLTITYTKFFRDAEYFKRLFFTVLPNLDAYPKIKVWSLGCSGGEEVYSIAVMLDLLGLSARASIIGSDINELALASAREGKYPISRLKELQSQFRTLALPDNYSLIDRISVHQNEFSFKQHISGICQFAKHNIVNGGSLGVMHLVCCRNVLIYLSESEQKRVLETLLLPSLEVGGYLMLGDAENVEVLFDLPQIEKLAMGANIYRKTANTDI